MTSQHSLSRPAVGHRIVVILSIAMSVLTCLIHADAEDGDEAARPSIEERLSDPVYMSWIAHDEVTQCVRCHLEGPNVGEILAGNQNQLTAFSRRLEMERWIAEDKHTIARRRVEPFEAASMEKELDLLFDRMRTRTREIAAELKNRPNTFIDESKIGFSKVPEEWIGDSNVLSRRICDKLWGPSHVDTPEGYAKFRDACLTCHGGYKTGDSEDARRFDFVDKGNAQLGIDCLYCHQDDSVSKQWVTKHTAPEDWRLLDPKAKTAAGMRHLVDVSNQANLCFDCHVGNRDKHMFVTHEMYAAGHPPIPSVELQEFCEKMPQHWQTPSQLYNSLKDYPQRDEYFQTNYPGLLDSANAGDVFWKTRKMLIGALAARQRMLDLYIASASADQWADYSLYDCAACHHELKTDSQRQRRGYTGAPGRPRQNEWPDALLDIAYLFYAYQAQPQSLAQIRILESEIETAFSDQPFGDPKRIAATASQLRDHIESAINEIEQKPVDARIATTVLRRLAETPADRLLTYDSARQVVWAIQTITSELEAEGFGPDEELKSQIMALGNPEVTGIEPKLPAGRKQFIYAEKLKEDLDLRANYEPSRLAATLRSIADRLKAQ